MDDKKPATLQTYGLMSVITLALGTLAVGTDVFIVAGFLPAMAQSLNVSAANAGQSVTVSAVDICNSGPGVGSGHRKDPAPRPACRFAPHPLSCQPGDCLVTRPAGLACHSGPGRNRGRNVHARRDGSQCGMSALGPARQSACDRWLGPRRIHRSRCPARRTDQDGWVGELLCLCSPPRSWW